MGAQPWELENLPDDRPIAPPDQTADLLADVIDFHAAQFAEPPKVRNAIYNVLKKAEGLNIDDLCVCWAFQRLEIIFSTIEHYRDPLVTLDALRVLAHMGEHAQNLCIADLARKHSIAPSTMHDRVLRVAKHLGIEYQKSKPRK